MKTIKVSEATERQLDWLVAKIEEPDEGYKAWVQDEMNKGVAPAGCQYSANWLVAGPIIEREHISIHGNPAWTAKLSIPSSDPSNYYTVGCTPLIAAMRCYCLSKLGEKVGIPEELV